MSLVSLSAHFDGERILLDEPFEIEPNARMIVTLLPAEANAKPEQTLSAKRIALTAIQSGKCHKAQTPDGPSFSERFALAKQEEKEREERRWTP